MKINRELLQKLAHLARIEIHPEMESGLLRDMEQIIRWIDKLDELDTTDIAPLTHMTMEQNVMREDAVQTDITPAQALKNAPVRQDQFFSVPKVLSKKND